jgi:hypothetical protein
MISFIIIVQIHFSWIAATHTYVIRIYSFRWKKSWHKIYSKFNNFFFTMLWPKESLPWSLLFLLVVRGSLRNSNSSWGIWGITFAIPRGMRKMRNQIFYSPRNEEAELAKIFGDLFFLNMKPLSELLPRLLVIQIRIQAVCTKPFHKIEPFIWGSFL